VDAIVVALVLPPYFSLCASALVYLCVLFLVAFVFAHCSLLFLRIVTKFEYLFFCALQMDFFPQIFDAFFPNSLLRSLSFCVYRFVRLAYDTVMMYLIAITKPKQCHQPAPFCHTPSAKRKPATL